MRAALPFTLLVAFAVTASARDPLPAEGKTSFSRTGEVYIPFELRGGGPTSSVKLYYALDGAAWQEADTVYPGGARGFSFKADRDGVYSFATMTHFRDGTSDPARKDLLHEQRRVVVDRAPPRINSLRSSMSSDGAPGIEWDVTDDNMDNRGGVKLEFRWPEMTRYEPIDRTTPFSNRDHRHWQLKATDRMQVRIVATDKAGNKTESDPVWVSIKDAEKGGETVRGGGNLPKLPPLDPAKDVRDSSVSPAAGTGQPQVHYVNHRDLKMKYDAICGQSGLTHSYLWASDDKLEWKMHMDTGPKAAVGVAAPDKPRSIPLEFEYKADKDGAFHFIIIVANHRGPSRRDPKKGETGDIQVIVDTQKPAVDIVSTRVSPNGDRGAVVDIRWKATDANIAAVPIMIDYRPEDAKEDWKAVTPDWIDNTGQHTWTAPTGEAHKFLIRVRSKDRAGNIGEKVSTEAVNTDLAVPSVDYKDVVPGVGGIEVLPGGIPKPPR